MNARKSRVIGAAAAITLGASALLAPAASAANKTIVVWTDETRGPSLTKLMNALPPNIPGYEVQVKAFSALTALDAAWANATAATGPDVVISNSAYASQGAKDGKLMPLTLPSSVKSKFSAGALGTLSYKGSLYGIPLDMDTTAMYVNTKLVKVMPRTFGDMVKLYLKNKSKFTAGFCALDGVWGSQPVITALGGYAWGLKSDGTANIMNVGLDAPKFVANFKKFLLAKNGKSNGFFKWADCTPDFLAGKIPFANSGGWNLDKARTSLGSSNLKIMAVPGVKAGTTGAPWTGYQGAYVTTFSGAHGVSAGAMQFVIQYLADAKTQAKGAAFTNRPPANLDAAAQVTDPSVAGFSKAGSRGVAQVDMYLNNTASGANWYDLLTDMYTKILTKGAPLKATLRRAAQSAQMDFVAGYKE
ncbi:MAG: sugar ABC transporter substrate-binding protein [Candidatus Nanopelagicales bacterium]